MPAAVVLVDTNSAAVTYVNPTAREWADLPLPAAAPAWSAAAGLRPDPGDDPLVRAAAGLPVQGVPVRREARQGEHVVWVTAFPLPAVAGLHGASLVVFLPVDPGLEGTRLFDVQARALVAAGLSFTISDPHQPDNPLIWVNPAFQAVTGYTEEELLGRNCRFLQGPHTDPVAVARIRQAIAERRMVQEVLLNHRKDGSAFWNEVSISPVFDGAGRLTHFVGVQADVTARIEAELERAAHLRAEQEARAHAEWIQQRFALLADATQALVETLDVEVALQRLVDVMVPAFADWSVVDLVDGSSGRAVHQTAGAHADASLLPALSVVQEVQSAGSSVVSDVLRTGQPRRMCSGDIDLDEVPDGELREALAAVGWDSALVVPLVARQEVLGTLTCVRVDPGRCFQEEDLELAVDLSRRASLIVDNARLYAREHHAAEALQRSMLPLLPRVEGLDIAARYLPGGVGAAVGGDWYDLLPLPDGTVGLAIGDVMGHDMAAAAAMGQLRSVLRSYAWQGQSPAEVLDSLDRLVQGLDMAQLATTVFAKVRFAEDAITVDYANAGHLPPFVRLPDGDVRRLEGGWSVLIGAPAGSRRAESRVVLPAGSLLVLCTDGLVESRAEDLDSGLDRLERALAGIGGDEPAQAVCDRLVEEMEARDREDDTALLVVRLLGRRQEDAPPAGRLEPGVAPARRASAAPVEVSMVLPVQPTSARAARAALRELLVGSAREHREAALLLATELVTNAVRHGRGPIALRAAVRDDLLRVEVTDGDRRLPVLRRADAVQPDGMHESGRGLLLVEALAHEWGCEPGPSGKRVWFELLR